MSGNRDSAARVDALSPAKRALLERSLAGSGRGAIPVRGTSEPAVLSFNQRRQWFLDRLAPDGSAYNVAAATRFTGPLDVASLKQALQAVVDRHEVLRASIIDSGGEPLQRIAALCPVELSEVDLSSLPEDEWEREVRLLGSEVAGTPLDLERGPLFRFSLYHGSRGNHVLLRVLNHIITDGWSETIFQRDLGEAYSAAVLGREPGWPPLPVQYPDFAVWQRRQFTGDRLESQLSYWRTHLAGAPPALEMVTDLPRPSVATERGAIIPFHVPAEVVTKLTQLAHASAATPFMVVMAAYARLLALYSGQTDVVVGIPIAGRNAGGLDDLIGFFVNSLPIRVDLSGGPTFRELLGRVKQLSLDAFSHQELPFDRLVEELRPERDLSRSPVFQTMVAFQNVPGSPPVFDGLTTERFQLDRWTTPFDLTLTVRPSEAGWDCHLAYRTDIFTAVSMEELTRSLGTLLERAVNEPDALLSNLPLASATGRDNAVRTWNDTSSDYPDGATVNQLFEKQCRATPDSVAIVSEDETLTYGELNARANRLARRLREQEIPGETVVGVATTRSIETIVSLLAVLKAGGAYLPINPEEPGPRLAFMLANAGARILLSSEPLEADPGIDGVTVINPGEAPAEIAARSDSNLDLDQAAGDLAYVIYTSGSTGEPKGVEVEHRCVVSLVRGAGYADFAADRVFLQLAPVSFDASTFEIWGPLLNGARLVVHPETRPSVAGLRRAIDQNGVTTMWLTATLFNALVDEAPESLRGIQQLLTGGEALSPAHIQKAQTSLPDTQLINGYGPTECTTFACTYAIPRETWGNRRSIPVGRPIANRTAYVLDEGMNVCPVGMPGELYIGGAGVARGYVNDPQLTAERFLDDPFSETPGTRLYRTGDVCRYLEGGLIEFVGRTDNQIKIRGFRIEPGEIVAVLNRFEGIAASAVTVKEHEVAGKSLVAYIVADDPVPAIDDIKLHIGASLPAYMMPAFYVMLEDLPLTSGGKVDTRALPDPPAVTTDGSARARPRDAIEVQLTAIWGRVLGVTGVGIDDDFFALGGNSLLALTLFSEMEHTLGESLPLAALFQAPTIRQLVKLWNERGPRKPWSCVVPIQPRGSRPPFFCVHGLRGNVISQRTLAEKMGPDQPFYGIQAVGLDGRTPPLRSVEAMAQRYVTEIRTVRPQGPYIIGGHCYGGMVAFEMARILEEDGDPPPLVVMIDSPIPLDAAERKASKPKADYLKVILAVLRRLRLLPSRNMRDWIWEVHRLARDRYVPQNYRGDVLSFTSTHFGPANTFSLERRDRWDRLMDGKHECRVIDGHHSLILVEPAVGLIADAVNQRVDEWLAGAARAGHPESG